jgi:hypothetical protein
LIPISSLPQLPHQPLLLLIPPLFAHFLPIATHQGDDPLEGKDDQKEDSEEFAEIEPCHDVDIYSIITVPLSPSLPILVESTSSIDQIFNPTEFRDTQLYSSILSSPLLLCEEGFLHHKKSFGVSLLSL